MGRIEVSDPKELSKEQQLPVQTEDQAEVEPHQLVAQLLSVSSLSKTQKAGFINDARWLVPVKAAPLNFSKFKAFACLLLREKQKGRKN